MFSVQFNALTTVVRTCLIVALACALVSVTLVWPTPSHAQTGGVNLHVVKTDGAGSAADTPMPGAIFEVRLLEGFEPVSQQQIGDIVTHNPALLTDKPGYEYGPIVTAVTDESGEARFDALAPGVYQVVEKPRRDSNVAETLATPTLVSIRGVETDGPDVFVRAKNQPLMVEKVALEDFIAKGDTLDYSITSSVPERDVNGRIHQYYLFDKLDPRVRFDSVQSIEVKNLESNTTLTEGVHYEVVEQDNKVGINFVDAGLRVLADARLENPETRVITVLRVKLVEDLKPTETVTNVVSLAADGYCVPNDPPVQTQARGLLSGFGVAAPAYAAETIHDAHLCGPGEIEAVESNPADFVGADTPTPPKKSTWPWWLVPVIIGGLVIGGSGSSNGSSEGSAHPDGSSSNDGSSTAGDNRGDSRGDGHGPASQGPDGAGDGSSEGRGSSRPLSAIPDSLASTGASVLGVVALGVLAILLGLWLRRRKADDDAAEPAVSSNAPGTGSETAGESPRGGGDS